MCTNFVAFSSDPFAPLQVAGIGPDRLGGRGLGIHSPRKTAINDAIRNGATMHEVREFAGHADSAPLRSTLCGKRKMQG